MTPARAVILAFALASASLAQAAPAPAGEAGSWR